MIIFLMIIIILSCIITIVFVVLEIELFSLRRQYLVSKNSQKPCLHPFNGFIVVTNEFIPRSQIWINPDDLPKAVIK